MPNHGFGRCDCHHKMVDCIGLAPGDFPIRTRELEIDRKKMTGQIGRSTFVSPVARLLGFRHAFGRAVLQYVLVVDWYRLRQSRRG
jgi:hypothetical protein